MKKLFILLFPVLQFILFPVISQTTVLHSFIPENNAIVNNNPSTVGEYLYGTKYDGGAYGFGYIYKIKADKSGYEVLLNLDGENTGACPTGSFAINSNTLYGVTQKGGINNNGILYKINTDGTSFQKLFDFDGLANFVRYPLSLIFYNGKLYGTADGGAHGYGEIFKIELNGSGFEDLHDFSTSGGNLPYSPLTPNGPYLYGTTQGSGGIDDSEVLYRISLDGTSFEVLHSFTGINDPAGPIVIINNFVYGTTLQSEPTGGKLYRITTDGHNYEVLLNFTNYGGSTPTGLTSIDSKLYGMLLNGGIGYGSVFGVDTTGNNFSTLVQFDKTNGRAANGSLTANGSLLYGYVGDGPYNYGVLFSVDTLESAYTKIKDFEATNDGYNPEGAMVISNNKAYGIATGGGKYNKGVMYSMNHDGSGYQVIHDFNGEDGIVPLGHLVIHNDTLFGMTQRGGAFSCGVVFIYIPADNTYHKIYDFTYETGYYPSGFCIYESQIYGMTAGVGNDIAGVVFKMNMDGTGFAPLLQASGSGLRNLSGYPVISESVLYGLAMDETNKNTLFSIHTDGSQYTVLPTSNGVDAVDWVKSPVFDGEYLYEVTSNGGINNVGLIFRIKTDGSAFEKIYDFDVMDGASSRCPLILIDTMLYGTTSSGGPTQAGGVFRIRKDGTHFENLLDFQSCFDLPMEKSVNRKKGSRYDNRAAESSSGISNTVGYLSFMNDDLYIVATAPGGTGVRSEIFKYSLIPTGIDNSKIPSDIKVYPNPAHEFVIIEGMSNLSGHVRIYNAAGIVVKDCILKDNLIDIGQLSTGVYSVLAEGQWFKIVKL